MPADPPPGTAAFATWLTGKHLAEPGSLDTLGAHLAELRAYDVIQFASKVNCWLERLDAPPMPQSQHQTIDVWFGDCELATLLHTLLEVEGEDGCGAIFYPGQMRMLQKLAHACCQAGPPTTFEDMTKVGDLMLAAAQVNDVAGLLDPTEKDPTLENLVMNSFRAVELGRMPHIKSVVGRGWRLWMDPELQGPKTQTMLDEYCQANFGMDFERFVFVGMAPAIMRANVTDPTEVVFKPADLFADTNVQRDEYTRVLDALTFEPNRSSEMIEDAATFWNHFDLADRPYLVCSDHGLLAPSSLRHVIERVTTYVFWMLHTAHRGRVGDFTTLFGPIFEGYCLKLVEGLRSDGVTVSGEVVYGREAKKSSDVLVTSATGSLRARVFIECGALHPHRSLFDTASVDGLDAYLTRVTEKLEQVDRSIRDHMAREFPIDGDLAGPDDPYFPVLVVDEPFQWTNHFGQLLGRRISGLFRSPQVARPTVMSVADLEYLVGLCERSGDDLASVVRDYVLSLQADPLDHFLFKRGGPLQQAEFCASGFLEFSDAMRANLFAVSG